MFEKEAEEIANKRCHEIMCFGHCSFSSPKHHRCGEWHREYECALKGAEFGYNKGKNEAKEIMNIAIEGIKYWGIVGGTERPFEKQSEKLFNLFLDKAEQFLKEVEK